MDGRPVEPRVEPDLDVPEVEPRSSSRPRGPGISIPPPLLFAGFLAAGHIAHSLSPRALWPSDEHSLRWGLGWTLVALGNVGCFWAWRQLLRRSTPITLNRDAKAVVTSGPYRFSRNPMYLSLFLIAAGVAVLWNALWPLLSLPVLWVVLDRWVVRREERHLGAQFPEEYGAYRSRVRRWL